jgi:group I intron endonuclease
MSSTANIVIYEITNLLNQKSYIGLTTKGGQHRWCQHKASAARGEKSPLYNAIRKYGIANFRFDILAECTSKEQAKEFEIWFIAKFKPSYNRSTGGESHAGHKLSPAQLKRLSDSHKGMIGTFLGKTHTPETRKRLSELGMGQQRRLGKKSPGSGLKAAATKRERGTVGRPPWTGGTRSEETRLRISTAKTGKPRSPIPEETLDIFRENMRRAARARRKKIVCLNDQMVFSHSAEAAKHYGLHEKTPGRLACNGGTSLSGLRFAYVDD